MSFRAGVSRVWNAGKRLFQTNETKVCAFVPSQELPHTPSVEPTPTDPLETRPTDPLESRPTDPLETRPTDPLESRPTDPLESRPTDPLESRPTDPLESRPTDPLESRPTDPLESRPTDPTPARVQEVGWTLKSRGDRSDYEGFRNSDHKEVIIRCIKKSRPEKLVKLPECPFAMSPGAAAMLMLQKHPTSTHIIQFYDMYILKDEDVLVLEVPHHSMTLFEFYQRNRGSLTEHAVKYIIRQLVVALQHCIDHGVYHITHMMNVLINPNTLQVKLTDFGGTLFFKEKRADEPILYSAVRKYAEWVSTDDTRIVLDHLVTRIGRWFWQRPHLSKGETNNKNETEITLLKKHTELSKMISVHDEQSVKHSGLTMNV
ncbi:hypothetical protein PO909_008659 [Leuciscus waleckii]